MDDHARAITGSGIYAQARLCLQQRMAEGALDGFLAAAFLMRRKGEDNRRHLESKLVVLGGDDSFSRPNVACLGVALGLGWLPATPVLISRFGNGYDRLERQQPGVGVDFRRSLRLLWGIALGAAAPAVSAARPDVVDRVRAVVEDIRRNATSPRDQTLDNIRNKRRA